jgi:hypothetical protein
MPKEQPRSPYEAVLSSLAERPVPSESFFEPNEFHIIFVPKKMNSKNGFTLNNQKFGTVPELFSILGSYCPKSVPVDVYYDELDCRTVTCVAMHPITKSNLNYIAHNVKHSNSKIPLSFNEADSYQKKYTPVQPHKPTTVGIKTTPPKRPESSQRSIPVDLDKEKPDALELIKNAGKIKTIKKKSSTSNVEDERATRTLFGDDDEFEEL